MMNHLQKLKRGFPKKCVLYEIIFAFDIIIMWDEMIGNVYFFLCVAVTGGNARLFGEEPASFLNSSYVLVTDWASENTKY